MYQQRESQISEREIERKYAKVKAQPAEADRVNCYKCNDCSHIMKTIDIHEGTTPMFLRCDNCGGQSRSSWYNDLAPTLPIGYEWRVPTLEQTKKFKRNPGMLEHIFSGGLELYKIK